MINDRHNFVFSVYQKKWKRGVCVYAISSRLLSRGWSAFGPNVSSEYQLQSTTCQKRMEFYWTHESGQGAMHAQCPTDFKMSVRWVDSWIRQSTIVSALHHPLRRIHKIVSVLTTTATIMQLSTRREEMRYANMELRHSKKCWNTFERSWTPFLSGSLSFAFRGDFCRFVCVFAMAHTRWCEIINQIDEAMWHIRMHVFAAIVRREILEE